MSLRTQIGLLIGACMLAMLAIVGVSLERQRTTMLAQHQAANEKVVGLAVKVAEHFHELETKGTLSRAEAHPCGTDERQGNGCTAVVHGGRGQHGRDGDAAIGGVQMQFVPVPADLVALSIALGAAVTGGRNVREHL